MNEFINLKRLEFAVTYRCGSKCDHCFVDENKKREYPGVMKMNKAKSIVKKVASEYNIESIMTFGGEPLLFPDVINTIHKTAKESGIKVRQVITNGYWSKDDLKIEKIARDMVASGVNTVLISVDAFHEKYIPLSTVKKATEALINNGIEMIKWNPCWVVSKDNNNKYNLKTKEILDELKYLDATVSNVNIVSPNGMALRNLKKYMPSKIKYPEGECADQPYTSNLDDIKSICIEPNGDIAICTNFKIGNIFEMDILEAVKNYNPYDREVMKFILEKGMKGLMEYANGYNYRSSWLLFNM